jgi:hypothetical protein
MFECLIEMQGPITVGLGREERTQGAPKHLILVVDE